MEDILKELNKEQKEAVCYTEGPEMILAGAGSGKTRVLTYKVAYLVAKKKVNPGSILLVTFTNKAAAEMKLRVEKILSRVGISLANEKPFAGTFHSFCAKVLRRDGRHLGLSPSFVIYDEADQKEAVKQAMEHLDISIKNYHPNAILNAISEAKNELISELDYPQYANGTFAKIVAQVYLTYQGILKKNQAFDFDDLISKAIKLLEKNSEVLTVYQEKYRYLLIDEYQDTNRAQYVLSKLLAKRYRNLCVVGDASQSIYSWRGADYRNLTNLKNDYPNLKIFHLEENYRSTQKILDSANAVIAKNSSHPVLKLWTKNQSGEKIFYYYARNEQDEAMFIIEEIKQLINHGFSLEECAVLYRTNAQSRVIEEAFLHFGIPYVLVGGTRFYERKEIKDVLSMLKVIVNPQDNISLKRIEKIGKRKTEKFLQFSETLGYGKKDSQAIDTIEILDRVVRATDYLDLYDENEENDRQRLENIKELRSVASEFPNLIDFLENVSLVEQEYYPDKNLSRTKDAVTLMTLHAAKGLEFRVVFIIGMEEGIFPHSRSIFSPQEIEEERRLCYVGMTRAKEKLYLVSAAYRLFFGSRAQNQASRFLADIPDELVTVRSFTSSFLNYGL